MATGLRFRANDTSFSDVRIVFSGANLLSRTDATFIWKSRHVEQSNGLYFTNVWWTQNTGSWDSGAYSAGFHPYPCDGTYDANGERLVQLAYTHYFEIAGLLAAKDFIASPGGPSYLVTKDVWTTQACKVEVISGTTLRHSFYPDLDNPTKVIVQDIALASLESSPTSPIFAFGSSPWTVSSDTNSETASGIHRFFKAFATPLSLADIQSEAAEESNTPVTTAGIANVWYTNIDPTPSDITDKSGEGHDPTWATSYRPAQWTGGGREQIGPFWEYYSEGSASTTIVLPARDIAAGSLIRIAVRNENGGATVSVADTASGTWQSQTTTANSVQSSICWAWDHPGGTGVVITITFSSSQDYRWACAFEHSGGDTADPAQIASKVTSSSNSPSHAMTVTPDCDTMMVHGSFSSASFDSTAPTDLVRFKNYSAVSFIEKVTGTSQTQAHTGGSGSSAISMAFTLPAALSTSRPSAITAGSWTDEAGGTLTVTDVNDDSDSTGAMDPAGASYPVLAFTMDTPMAAVSQTVYFRGRDIVAGKQARQVLFANDGTTVVATGAWHTMTGSLATYSDVLTPTATAYKGEIQTQSA